MAYRNYSYYLGLRKLAGLRSVAPAVAYFDTNFGQTAYAINKNEVFHLWGCEMTALRADCVRIRYKSSSKGQWVVIKDYLNQTSLSVAGSSSGPDHVQGFPQASGNFVGSDGSGNITIYRANGVDYGNEEKPYGPIGQPVISHNDGSYAEIDVLFENFSRAFKFLVPGYYSIDFDITKSALYKQLATNNPIVNPDEMDYNNFSKNATVPWTPVDKATLEYGDLLVSNILVRCVDNVDVINGSSYSLSPYAATSQRQSGLPTSSSISVYRNPGLVVNSIEYDSGTTASAALASQDYIIYVSDSIGNDSWTGQESTVSGMNGPVKTIQKAATLARNYSGGQNVQIQIRGGNYKMLGTVTNPIFYLNANDSGKNGRFVTYKPFENEEVIISGSESISASAFAKVTSSDSIWNRISTAARGNVYVANVSAYDLGELPEHWRGNLLGGDDRNFGVSQQLPGVADLSFNGQKMTLSRWPNKSSLTSGGFTFSECATISSVIDTGTNGVYYVDPFYLSTQAYNASRTPAESTNGCYGRDADGIADPNCFRNGIFTYSSNYDSVISKWKTSGLAEGIWLSGFWRWDWAFETYKIVSIDTSTRQITVRSKNSHYGIQNYTVCDLVIAGTGGDDFVNGSYIANPTPRRWVAYNILEELDSPGEYYIDRVNEKLYFWPPSAINSSSDIRLTHRAVAGPSAKSTGRFEIGFNPNTGEPSTTWAGDAGSGPAFPYPGWVDMDGVGYSQTGGAIQSRHVYNSKNTLRSLWKLYKVNNIIIEGLTFRDSAGSGLEMQLCENITVVKCKVNNIRNHGIKAPGGKNITIDSCTVYDIGLSGIINTGGNKQTLTPANKVITKCSVKRCNLLNQVETSVVIHGCGNTLSYSLISDGMTAVQCDGNNHIIEYNHFDNIGHGQDDAGTIYSGRNSSAFGHIIRYNFFNNCGSRLPGGCQYDNVNGCGGRPFVNGLPTTPPNPNETQWTIGVYWDDLESGHTVKGNVFYNCGSGPKGGACGFNGGVYHNVENNIIIGSAVGYGSSMYGSNYWNDSLRGKKWSTYNPNNWPWYETGGPLGPNGEVKYYTGYGPYNAEWVIGHGAGGFDSPNWAGIMHAVDIRKPEYVSSYPNLAKLIKQNANGDPELDITNINDFKNIAKNNVIVQCGQPLATWPGSGGGVPVGGWIVSGEVVTNTYPDFVNAAALNFKLTPAGLNAIRAQSPTFEDIPFENIPTKNYVPEAYSVNTTTGNKTSCSSDKYMIDTSYLPMFTSASNDQNISVPPSSVMRNFRNRIFDSVVFNGPGDFVMHEQLQSGARCAITVDMRNTRFYHCEFNSIVFGADSGSQLILDGSIFYSCDFRNCKFNISPKNMLFNKCRINNCHEFMNAYGAYGNAFAGLAANDVLNLFNFIGGKSGNDNNLFTFINVNSSLSQSTHNCFISCIPGSSGSGSFSGNIAFRNYVDGSDGDPVHIGKVNAHGNLFSNNYFFSSGKISLADNQKEKEKRFNKDSNQYPILRQYVQNTSTYDPLKDTNHWYTKIDIGTCGPNSTLFYDGMSSGFVSAWQGNRYGDVNGQTGYDLLTRAFPFECDPVDPNVSSPWHNAIYELTIDKYQWGFRSFQYNFLFGSCDGSTQVSFATWNKWKNNYTDTSPNSSLEYPNSKCKARWKGMTQAIRSVLEGNLTPKDGRQSVAEPCNVALYIQSCRGYFMYRNATNAIWNGLPGTNAQKDAAFYAILDDVINDIISIKGRTQSSGKMSVILDAVSYSATPSHIELFRSCSDYRTDALELADWYIKTKLEQAGIQVFYESKYKKTANKADIGNGAVSSISYPVGWAGVPFYADDYWIWYTSPNRPTPPGPGVFSNWVANSDVPIIYRGLNAYWPTNAGERAVDLYHSISTVNVGNAVRDLNINTADNPGPLVNYYTAQYAAAALYSWSDHFRYYENLKSGSGVYKGVLLSTPNYMNVDFGLVSNGYDVLPIYSTNPSTGQPFDPYNSYWRLSVIAAKNSVFFANGAQRYFDSASFVANPTGYQGIYWTQAGLSYWDQSIRQSSLANFVNVIRSFSSQAAPQSAVAEGWNGPVYPNDSWTKSIITSDMYSEWTIPDPPLPEPTSILDYEVWAVDWQYLGPLRQSVNNPNGYGSANYETIAIVPTVIIAANEYNGYRPFSDNTSSTFSLITTITEASNIPVTRRVLQPYCIWDDLPALSGTKANHYINNTNDGTTYLGVRFQTMWHDVQYNDVKNALIGIFTKCANAGITFPYCTDNRGLEVVGRIYPLQGAHTNWTDKGFDADGNPLADYGNKTVGGVRRPDARFFAANIADSRFTTYVNPQTGKTIAARMIEFYNALSGNSFSGSAVDLYSKAAGVTLFNDFIYYGGYTEKPYSFYRPGAAVSEAQRQDEIYKAQAWIGAVDEFINGYYAVRCFTEAKQAVPGFENMKYSSYEMDPVSLDESKYFKDSNDQPIVKVPFPNMAGSKGWYGWHGNIIYPLYAIETLHEGSNVTIAPNYVSGYVINPQTDFERYNWQGHQNPSYVPSVGATLVRYAHNPVINYAQWKLQVSHKQFVNDVKLLRHMFITNPNYYEDHTPFLNQFELGSYPGNTNLSPAIPGAPTCLYNDTYNSARYLREFVYHTLLHGVLFVMNYGAARNIVQEILDTWRNISYNSHSRPCSNSTGNINLPVDRLILADAITNVTMSGGRMVKTGKYLWRITAPPSAIRSSNTILFQRVGSDSDIPAQVIVDCTDPLNGYGMWIKRNISTPPRYIIIPE